MTEAQKSFNSVQSKVLNLVLAVHDNLRTAPKADLVELQHVCGENVNNEDATARIAANIISESCKVILEIGIDE